MITINNVSNNKFSYNGITYHKNFMPFVYGNKVAILNAYDGCIFLTESPTHFSEFTVNGATFASAALLQSALLDVIFTRSSLGGSGAAWGSIIGTLSTQTDLQDALNLKANDNEVVHLTGDETISGRKTFNSTTDIGIRSNISGSGVGVYSENSSNGISFYVANNGSGKGFSVANALNSFGNMYEGSYNGNVNFIVNYLGQVGIGTGTPNTPLDVVSNVSAKSLKIRNRSADDLGNIIFSTNDGSADNAAIGWTTGRLRFMSGGSGDVNERLSILTNGNVLIGSSTSLGSYKLQLTGLQKIIGADTHLDFGQLDANNVYFQALNTAGNAAKGFVWYGTSEYMRITSGGNVGIGTTSPGVSLEVNGLIRSIPIYNNTTASAANLVVSSGGTFERSTSSLKYKKEVRNYDKGLDELLQIRPVYYKGKSESDGDKQFAGLIAEEIHNLGLTEFVQYADDNTPDALAYTHMIALLISSIQEQQQQIQELSNEVWLLKTL